jgi:hypothetical protein
MGAYYSTVPPIVETSNTNASAVPAIAPPPPVVIPSEVAASADSAADERAIEV